MLLTLINVVKRDNVAAKKAWIQNCFGSKKISAGIFYRIMANLENSRCPPNFIDVPQSALSNVNSLNG